MPKIIEMPKIDVNPFGSTRRRKKVKEKKVKKRKKIKLKGPRVLKAVKYQTGKRESLRLDRKRKALPPGKRISKSGRIYWETRRNRSDLKGKKI